MSESLTCGCDPRIGRKCDIHDSKYVGNLTLSSIDQVVAIETAALYKTVADLQAKLERAEAKINVFNKQDAEWPKVVNRMAQMKDNLTLAEKRIKKLRKALRHECAYDGCPGKIGPHCTVCEALATDDNLEKGDSK